METWESHPGIVEPGKRQQNCYIRLEKCQPVLYSVGKNHKLLPMAAGCGNEQ